MTDSRKNLRRRPVTSVAKAALAVLMLLVGVGCGARPYRAMAKAATSEENVFSEIDDHRLKASLRTALVQSDASASIHITPYVYMGHAYLVGFVDSPQQRETALAAANGVAGIRSLDTYLPDRPAPAEDTGTASDLSLKAEVKAKLALDPNEVVTRIELEVLDGHVVLLGVVASEAAQQAAVNSTQSVSGVTGVSNFLLVPEAAYGKLRPSLR